MESGKEGVRREKNKKSLNIYFLWMEQKITAKKVSTMKGIKDVNYYPEI